MVIIVQILPISKPSVKKLAVILSAPGAILFILCLLMVIETISCRAGDACITYTVLNNDDEGTVEIESKFCGQVDLPYFPSGEANEPYLQVQRMWDGAVVTNGRCYTEYGVSILKSPCKKKSWYLSLTSDFYFRLHHFCRLVEHRIIKFASVMI